MKWLLVFLFIVSTYSVSAQEAIRQELYTLNPQLTAYHFTESGEYLFVLNCSYTTTFERKPEGSLLTKADGSFSSYTELLSGGAEEASAFFNTLSSFIERNLTNDTAALRMGTIMIHREKWRNGGFCDFFLPGGELLLRLTDKEFRSMQEAFHKYCEEHGL